MAKFTIAVQFTEDNGSTPIGPNIAFSNQTSHSAAKALIDAEIQNRINAAAAAAQAQVEAAQQKLLATQAIFNS